MLRLLALSQMVSGHTLDGTLLDSVRESAWYPQYDYMRGLVSVAFMVSAGLAYHLTTFVGFDPERVRATRKKRVLRAMMLIGIGFALKISSGLWSGHPDLVARSFAYLCRVDVLHCIGFSILVLEIISANVKSANHARVIAAGVAVLMLIIAPFSSRIPLTDDNRWWLDWFSHDGGSFFPIAPWAAYPLLGAAIGGLIAPNGEVGARQVPYRMIAAGVFFYGVSFVLYRLFPTAGTGIHPASNPAFFLQKLSSLLFFGAPIGFLVRNVRKLPRPLTVLTGETLVVYVFHLLVLYASFGPARVWPHQLTLAQALTAAAGMITISFAAGLAAPGTRRLVREWAALARTKIVQLREARQAAVAVAVVAGDDSDDTGPTQLAG